MEAAQEWGRGGLNRNFSGALQAVTFLAEVTKNNVSDQGLLPS